MVKWSTIKGSLTLAKGPRSLNGKRVIFLTNSAGKTGYPHTLKKNEAETLLYSIYKNYLETN